MGLQHLLSAKYQESFPVMCSTVLVNKLLGTPSDFQGFSPAVTFCLVLSHAYYKCLSSLSAGFVSYCVLTQVHLQCSHSREHLQAESWDEQGTRLPLVLHSFKNLVLHCLFFTAWNQLSHIICPELELFVAEWQSHLLNPMASWNGWKQKFHDHLSFMYLNLEL